MKRQGGMSDEDLLRLMHEVEDVEDRVDAAVEAAEAEAEAPLHDPCPACGEPAEHLGDCHVCGDTGCLPPDLWSPGMADPCLVVCARCARTIHGGCAGEDAAGNPACPSCKF